MVHEFSRQGLITCEFHPKCNRYLPVIVYFMVKTHRQPSCLGTRPSVPAKVIPVITVLQVTLEEAIF